MIAITRSISLDESEIDERFIRASGPGGQNVNKVETAVQLRLDVQGSRSLPDRVKERLAALAGRRMTQEGVLVIMAQRYRTQDRNRADALERLVELIRQAAAPPPPKRRTTKPTRSSQERRLASKGKRGAIKSLRQDKMGWD